MSHAAMSLLEFLFPACFTAAFQNSFVLPWLLRHVRTEWARGLLTCPLCFGFWISLVWCWYQQLSWYVVFPMCVMSMLLGNVISLIRTADDVLSQRGDS